MLVKATLRVMEWLKRAFANLGRVLEPESNIEKATRMRMQQFRRGRKLSEA